MCFSGVCICIFHSCCHYFGFYFSCKVNRIVVFYFHCNCNSRKAWQKTFYTRLIFSLLHGVAARKRSFWANRNSKRPDSFWRTFTRQRTTTLQKRSRFGEDSFRAFLPSQPAEFFFGQNLGPCHIWASLVLIGLGARGSPIWVYVGPS